MSGPANTARLLVELVEEICADHALMCTRLSGDWILDIVDPRTKRSTRIIGYRFDLNGSASSRIADDKVGMSELLQRHAIPNIAHALVLRPDYFRFSPNGASAYSVMREIYEKMGPVVVAKPNDGTGGIAVYRCPSLVALEATAMAVFDDSHAMAISGYVDIEEERRMVVVQNEVVLAYTKIPAANDWRHNLAYGGQAQTVPLPGADGTDLALQAANAAGLHACAVDVVLVDGSWYVLEVNAGLVFESFGRTSEENRTMAAKIYERVILACLARI